MPENYTATMKRILARCEDEHLQLSIAGERDVFIDIDDSLDLEKVKAAIKHVHTLYRPCYGATVCISKGGQGLHVKLEMRHNVTHEERCVIALACGSDPKRDLLRLRAIHFQTDDVPSILLDKAERLPYTELITFPYADEVQPKRGSVENSNDPVVESAPTDGVQHVSPEPAKLD